MARPLASRVGMRAAFQHYPPDTKEASISGVSTRQDSTVASLRLEERHTVRFRSRLASLFDTTRPGIMRENTEQLSLSRRRYGSFAAIPLSAGPASPRVETFKIAVASQPHSSGRLGRTRASSIVTTRIAKGRREVRAARRAAAHCHNWSSTGSAPLRLAAGQGAARLPPADRTHLPRQQRRVSLPLNRSYG